MQFQIHIQGNFQKKLDKVTRSFPGEIKDSVRKATTFLHARVKEKTPAGQGDLRKSLSLKISGFQGIIRPTVKYAIFVHEGTRPHWVPKSEWALPTGSLYKWAMKKGLNPFLVARAIARKGTKKQPWMKETLETYESQVTDFFEQEVNRLIDRA